MHHVLHPARPQQHAARRVVDEFAGVEDRVADLQEIGGLARVEQFQQSVLGNRRVGIAFGHVINSGPHAIRMRVHDVVVAVAVDVAPGVDEQAELPPPVAVANDAVGEIEDDGLDAPLQFLDRRIGPSDQIARRLPAAGVGAIRSLAAERAFPRQQQFGELPVERLAVGPVVGDQKGPEQRGSALAEVEFSHRRFPIASSVRSPG